MKRRGFIGALFGLAAAPVVAKVLPKKEKNLTIRDTGRIGDGVDTDLIKLNNSDGGYLLPEHIAKEVFKQANDYPLVTAARSKPSREFADFLRKVKAASK